MEEPILAYVRRRLGANRDKWRQIAIESGVNLWTIRNIFSGRSPNPEIRNLQPLKSWFDGDSKPKKRKNGHRKAA